MGGRREKKTKKQCWIGERRFDLDRKKETSFGHVCSTRLDSFCSFSQPGGSWCTEKKKSGVAPNTHFSLEHEQYITSRVLKNKLRCLQRRKIAHSSPRILDYSFPRKVERFSACHYWGTTATTCTTAGSSCRPSVLGSSSLHLKTIT